MLGSHGADALGEPTEELDMNVILVKHGKVWMVLEEKRGTYRGWRCLAVGKTRAEAVAGLEG